MRCGALHMVLLGLGLFQGVTTLEQYSAERMNAIGPTHLAKDTGATVTRMPINANYESGMMLNNDNGIPSVWHRMAYQVRKSLMPSATTQLLMTRN